MVRARFINDVNTVEVNGIQEQNSVNVKSESIIKKVGIKSTDGDHNVLVNRNLPNQHPISAITGLEEALLNADKTFVFEQGIASDTWEITHNLNKYPSVTVVDSAGNEVIAEVVYTDTNNCVVTMTAAFKGKAYLN